MKKSIVCVLLALSSSVQAAEFGAVQGDMYLVTTSGEVRQGAANYVYLLPRDSLFASRWTEMCASQREQNSIQEQEDARVASEIEQRIDRATSNNDKQELRAKYIELLDVRIDNLILTIQVQSERRSEWVRSLAIQSASTGMNANYKLEGSPGDYWLFTEMQIGNNKSRWLVPISLVAGIELRTDLDNNNSLLAEKFNCDNQPFSVSGL